MTLKKNVSISERVKLREMQGSEPTEELAVKYLKKEEQLKKWISKSLNIKFSDSKSFITQLKNGVILSKLMLLLGKLLYY
jgi:hypothetical protein